MTVSNPFALPSPIDYLYGNVDDRRQAAPYPPLPPLSQAEQQSLLDRIGSTSLHGLGYLGGSLSKAFGGRAIRGLIGGRPEELASIIPFSDTLGITNPENEVRGSDLLGGDKNTSLLSSEGLGGLGIDIATDPATWFGGAIMSGLGKGAKLAGTGLTKIPKVGPVLDAGGNLAKTAYQRTIPPLFEKAVMGMTDPQAQILARRMSAATPETVARATGEVMPLAEQAFQAGLGSEAGNASLRNVMENALAPGPVTAQQSVALNIRDPFRQMAEGNIRGLTEAGVPANELAQQRILSGPGQGDMLGYTPRQMTREDPATLKEFFSRRKVDPAESYGRKSRYEGLPTERLNELKADPMVNASGQPLNDMQVHRVIEESYLGHTAADKNALTAMRNDVARLPDLMDQYARGNNSVQGEIIRLQALQGPLKEMEAKSVALFNQAKELAAMKMNGSLPQFKNSVLQDILDWHVDAQTRMMQADKLHQGVAEFSGTLKEIGEGAVPLKQALADMGMTLMPESGQPTQAAMTKTLDWLQKAGKASAMQDLDNLYVTPGFHKSMTGFMTASSIEGLTDVKKVWDSLTSLTKTFQTILWPANHARNQLTGFWNNYRVGAFNPAISGPMKYVDPWLDANKLIKGGEVIDGIAQKMANNPLFKGMDDAAVTKEIQRLSIQWDVNKNAAKMHNEFSNLASPAEEQLKSLVPGIPAPGLAERAQAYAKGFVPRTLEEANPLNVAGFAGRTKDTASYVKGGRELASKLDDVNRTSVFIAKLEQGMSARQAFEASIEAHYDFANLSRFEKDYMRRLVPYYSWMRANVPAVLGDFLKNPGGITGQSIRTAYEAQGRQPGFTPDYLGQGLAAKVGDVSPDGQQAYLSSTGLPFEDVAQIMRPSGLLGMLNPLLKGPLEVAANRQFYTGRELTGTVPHTGSTVGDQLLSASPLGRFATTGRMLLDPRLSSGEAAFNLLSGGRLTNVDQRAAQRRAILAASEEILRDNPAVRQFSGIYVSPQDRANLSPAELALLRLHQTVKQNR